MAAPPLQWIFGIRGTSTIVFVMEIALLVFLVVAVVVSVLVTRARGGLRRSWDDSDAWDALKRVGDKASKKSEREDRAI